MEKLELKFTYEKETRNTIEKLRKRVGMVMCLLSIQSVPWLCGTSFYLQRM